MENQNVMQEFKVLETGSNFLSENSAKFSENYKRRFVAVKDDKLIAVGDTFEETLDKVKEENIEPSSVLIAYIPDKGEIILY